MFELPRIKIEIENMRYQIVHAFASHNDEIERAVDQELTRVIANYPFGAEVASIASQVLTQAIKHEIEEFLLYGQGRKALSDVVDNLITSNLTKRAADLPVCTCSTRPTPTTLSIDPNCPVHGSASR
jgi:KaiC/GvpD/RAD55 family RecA-like ATPase